jgi:6-phosphogluconolactonase (cycloisomerase 2 family)
MSKTVFYQAIGPELTRYDIDVDGASLIRRDAVATPGAKIQYVWPHPSKKYLYAVSSDGGPGTIPGKTHIASAFSIDPSGALAAHGAPVPLPSRPIHCCVDASGQYLLTAFNFPSGVTVHRLRPDGGIGEAVPPRQPLDVGIFAHQVMTPPGNGTAILVTRGNNPDAGRPEDPGALKLYRFEDGVLSNITSIAPGNGLGFGPRHLDFHPSQPWVFVSVERQSELHVYRLNNDGTLPREALFIKNSLADRASHGPTQMAGAIHVHPNGRFVYQTNRNSGTEQVGGRAIFKGGENNVAVFSIDQATGEPALVQNIDARTNHLRTFAIDPSGRLLIAASIEPMAMRDGSTLAAALVLYRIGADGRLDFARKYDVDTGRFMQFWTGIVTLP